VPAPLRKLCYLLVFAAVAVPTCSGGGEAQAAADPVLLAQQMREGCVGSNLTLLLGLADYLAPLSEVTDLMDLVAQAGRPGCSLVPGTPHQLVCEIEIDGEPMILAADIYYLGADGLPVNDPVDASSLWVILEAAGPRTLVEGQLFFTPDPARGLVLSGELSTVEVDGCAVLAAFEEVTARRVADLAGGGTLTFTSGRAEISVQDPDARGSAALVGRRAVVALEIDGTTSHGEIDLDP